MPWPDTEEPNDNQSSFGPSNQQNSLENTQPASWGSPSTSQLTPTNQTNQGSIQPLPWQDNSMGQQQQSMSAPSWQTQDVGHEGTTQGGMNRNQFRDAWMQSGISNPQQMDQWLQAHGGQRLNEAGVVRTPFGEILDMGIGYKTGRGQPGWTDIGMNQMPQGNFGMMGQAPQQMNQQQMGQFGPQQQQMQLNPQMLQALFQLMQGPQGGMMQPMNQPRSNYFQNLNSDNNQMDISSLLGAPSGQLQNHYNQGMAQGQDMSWMQNRGLLGQPMAQMRQPFNPSNNTGVSGGIGRTLDY